MDSLLNGSLCSEAKEWARTGASLVNCLIVARLAGHPDFEALVVELTDAFKKSIYSKTEPNMAEWDKLVAYLRTEVQPLA
ncbi:hypothetical protein HNQ59_003907 [Chitinivorax tropicus]|uniref:Uncharacterized protein n=1 Tax=Chitinivorax tropicus TaxID=714531 RepID=A0A840MW89_9PROT|nr:hypothetical protein [Chitinivorax tropicus]MBB5020586.1 hypothetical protein [Chitinivorax tropicus]